MEATGHYSEGLAEWLTKKGVKVSVVNPLQIKHFGKVVLSRNKNDVIDAKLIALYAESRRPCDFVPQSKANKQLRELVQYRDTLIAHRVQLTNQLKTTSTTLLRWLKQAIQTLENRRVRVEKKISVTPQENKELREKVDLMTSIKGIGEQIAYTILSYLPSIDRFDRAKELATFAGLTPRQTQSGKKQGKTRLCKLEHKRLRKALYMPALVAKNKNEHLAPFVQRLENNGLKPKAIICPVLRKWLHWIFGILKKLNSLLTLSGLKSIF